jgi:ATP-dependent metalloprotease
MDGFNQSDGVIVIGATNFEQSLDSAIKRPGRFDKIINVPLPDIKGREDIFGFYLKKIKADNSVDASILARQSTGFTGADIQNVVNIAILNAIKEGRPEATRDDFEFAHDRIAMGIGRKRMFVSDKAKLTTAYHEGGHALASLLTEGAMPLHKVTILPRGSSLGHTAMLPEEDDDLKMTRRSMLASIDVAMGGRAAEELAFGADELTSGCGSDLVNATNMAYEYVRGLGMVEGGSFIVADKDTTSDRYNHLVDKEVQKILKESNDRVKVLLKRNESSLSLLAQELIKKETVSADEVRKMLNLTI